MSIQQKLRLLAAWLPAGIPCFIHGATTYLYLKDVPYEFEDILGRWLLLHPELTESDSSECALIDHTEGLAINQEGWEQFVFWIMTVARDRLDAMEMERGSP